MQMRRQIKIKADSFVSGTNALINFLTSVLRLEERYTILYELTIPSARRSCKIEDLCR